MQSFIMALRYMHNEQYLDKKRLNWGRNSNKPKKYLTFFFAWYILKANFIDIRNRILTQYGRDDYIDEKK